MASASYWQRGETLDYINDTEEAIEAGTVVAIGSHIGVVGTTVDAGAVGSVHVVGTFWFPKTGAAAIDQGTLVYWDGSGITDTAPSGEGAVTIAIGYAAAAAEAADEKILVKLNG